VPDFFDASSCHRSSSFDELPDAVSVEVLAAVCTVCQLSFLPSSQQMLEWRMSVLQIPGRTRKQRLQRTVAALPMLTSMERWGAHSSGVPLWLCGPCRETRLRQCALDAHNAEAVAEAFRKAVVVPAARGAGPAGGLRGVTFPPLVPLPAVACLRYDAGRWGRGWEEDSGARQ